MAKSCIIELRKLGRQEYRFLAPFRTLDLMNYLVSGTEVTSDYQPYFTVPNWCPLAVFDFTMH